MNSPISISETTINHLINACEESLHSCISAQHESLRCAWEHQFSARGKRSRMRLALNSSMALGLSPAQAERLGSVCELIHQASLIHDDLMDEDLYRNKQPTVWHKFGQATAVCLGDALLVEAMLQIATMPDTSLVTQRELMRLVRNSVVAAAEGQIDDCETSRILSYSYAEYCEAVKKKSGALFSMPVLGAMIVSNFSNADQQLAHHAFSQFGIAYQLLDDLQDKDVDKGKRLNGYWLLARMGEDNPAESLCNAVIAHLSQAEEYLVTLPVELQQSFQMMRSKILLTIPNFNGE